MRRLCVILCLMLLTGCADRTPPRITGDRFAQGVYRSPAEISDFSGTTLELKHGKFRYWFYSDVRSGNEPEYPLTGDYTFQNGEVALSHEQVNQRLWTVDVVHGIPVLWRDDALKAWKEERKIYDYGVLIWTADGIPEDDFSQVKQLSVRELYDATKKAEVKTWQDPFVHGPQ